MTNYLLQFMAAVFFTHAVLAAEDEATSEDTAVGVVIASLGEITSLNAADEELTLEYGSGVWREDIIGVGDNGKLQILLTDGTLMSAAAGTIFRITDYVYDGSAKDTLKVEIMEGTVRMLSGEIDKQGNQGIQVLTPETNVSVEGTLFTTHASKDGTAVGFYRGWGNLSTKAGVVPLGMGQDYDFSFVPTGDTERPRGQLAEPRVLALLETSGLAASTPTAVTAALQTSLKLRPLTPSLINDIKNRIRHGGRFALRSMITLRDRQVNLHADGIHCKCTRRH